MSMVRVSWNVSGFEQVRRSPETQRLIDSYVDDMVDAAGPGYDGNGMQGRSRYRGIVFPDSWSAVRDNGRHNTLVSLLGR